MNIMYVMHKHKSIFVGMDNFTMELIWLLAQFYRYLGFNSILQGIHIRLGTQWKVPCYSCRTRPGWSHYNLRDRSIQLLLSLTSTYNKTLSALFLKLSIDKETSGSKLSLKNAVHHAVNYYLIIEFAFSCLLANYKPNFVVSNICIHSTTPFPRTWMRTPFYFISTNRILHNRIFLETECE